MDCLVSPPQPGDESYDTFIKVSNHSMLVQKNCLYIYNSDLRQIFYDYLSEMLYLYQEKSSVRINLKYTLLFLARQCIGGLNSEKGGWATQLYFNGCVFLYSA